MRQEDLIKKLESLDLPDVEIKTHKEALRMALVSHRSFRTESFWGTFKKGFAVAVPAMALLIFAVMFFVEPKITEARAIKIARQDPEVQKLIGQQKEISFNDIKIKEGKAYLLFKAPEETQTGNSQSNFDEINDIEGAMIEIDLSRNKVENIKKIKGEEFSPLDNKEREEAKEIAASEEDVRKIIPSQAKVDKVQTLLPESLRLADTDHTVEVVSGPDSQKRAKVHYSANGKKWIIQVNLTEKKVEEVRYSDIDD